MLVGWLVVLFRNKAAIVKAGGIHKMLRLIESGNEAIAEAVVANFLGLSALDSNKPIIGCSGAIPFLVETLAAPVTDQTKQDCLRALYNLSILPSNVVMMLESSGDVIPYLLSKVGDMEMSERILCILGNVVSVAEGRKRISGVADAFATLMDVLNWMDSPGCQEKATYILMVMAHKSYCDRQTMIEAGIVSSLLELTLVGSTLAQKRASRMLECFKGKQLSTASSSGSNANNNNSNKNNMSAPLSLSTASSMELEAEEEMMMSQESKAVKQLVQQSLHNNMYRMVKRANLPHDFVPSHHLRSLTSSSTSKSLPF